MAPSPEDDNIPKAPDKNDKNKYDKATGDENIKEKDKEEKVRFVYFPFCNVVKSLIVLWLLQLLTYI